MTKTARKLIFLLFLGLFLISAPLVVLYTAGYRLNPQRLTLVKTGVLTISSEPKNSNITIDGINTNQKTNTVLKNIMPGEHLVRLEKEGYWPWEKKIEIKENETAFIQKAELFSSSEPTLKTSNDYSIYALDQTGEKIAFAESSEGWLEIWSRTLSSDEKKLLLRLPKSDFDEIVLSWSLFDNTVLIVKETKKSTVTWRSVQSDGQNKILSDNPFLVWERDANQLLLVDEYQKQTRLARRDQLGQEETLAVIPPGQYEFLPAPPSFVLLQDRARNKILLIDDRGVDQPILLNTDAISTAWNPQNEKQLLYASDFELHIFDAGNLSNELLTRVSTPIIGAAWHASGADVFYADSKNLSVTELDSRGNQRQTWTLATFDKIETFAPTNDGQMVYLVGTRGIDIGLFEKGL